MGSHHDLWQSGAAGAFDESFYRERGFSRAPLLVQWMVTEQCSLRCSHCLVGGSTSGPPLSLEEATRLLDQVAALGVQQLLLTGGEPLERPDLPEVVARLGERDIRWSLNTARLPGPRLRAALEAYPPGFVAVSLDGPASHHDRHRGEEGAHAQALESIAYFRDIVGAGQVAAGTTITRQSVGLLEQTFGEVLASGAGQWGLHVVFPEGRAAERSDLTLTRRQLRTLMRFAAEKRQHFPVSLGDEFGYLGSWEPLLREEPFFCGAGRTQCVVLADGEVVPCTTVDREVSAGNVRQRPLGHIWADGFAELRRPHLGEQCQRCDYAEACGGGCWLQRRQGAHCYRRVWSRPRELASAAGMAVCLGLASCAGVDTRAGRPADPAKSRPGVERATPPKRTVRVHPKPTGPRRVVLRSTPARIGTNDALEVLMLRWMRTQTQGRAKLPVATVLQEIKKTLGSDPAGGYLLSRLSSRAPSGLTQRMAAIEAALKTKQRSLSFAALLYRDLAEWCLDETRAAKRTAAERKSLRTTLSLLEKRTRQWRREVFAQKLSPFLTRDFGSPRSFMLLKSGHMRIRDRALAVVATKRYQVSLFRRRQLAASFLQGQPFARSMRLQLSVPAGSRLDRLTGALKTRLRGSTHVDIFDRLRVGSGKSVTVGLQVANRALRVVLPASTELTWADLLRLAYEQHRTVLDPWARGWRHRGANLALQIPSLRAQLAQTPSQGNTANQHHQIAWRLLSAWMF